MSRDRLVRIEPPKASEVLLSTAHGPTYPFAVIKVLKSAKVDLVVNLNVGPRLYEKILEKYGSDELLTYFDTRSGIIETFTRDMLVSLKFMEKIGAMSSLRSWVTDARNYMNSFLESKKAAPITGDRIPEVKALLEQILKATELLGAVEAKKELFAVAKDVLASRVKDLDTTVYRLAMAIFHTGSFTGSELLPELDDLARIYLLLTQSQKLVEEHRWLFEELDRTSPEARLKTTKTLMCFVAAAYVAYSVLESGHQK